MKRTSEKSNYHTKIPKCQQMPSPHSVHTISQKCLYTACSNNSCQSICASCSLSQSLSPRWLTLSMSPQVAAQMSPSQRSTLLFLSHSPGLCMLHTRQVQVLSLWTFSPDKNINATRKEASVSLMPILSQAPRTVSDTYQVHNKYL